MVIQHSFFLLRNSLEKERKRAMKNDKLTYKLITLQTCKHTHTLTYKHNVMTVGSSFISVICESKQHFSCEIDTKRFRVRFKAFHSADSYT